MKFIPGDIVTMNTFHYTGPLVNAVVITHHKNKNYQAWYQDCPPEEPLIEYVELSNYFQAFLSCTSFRKRETL